MQSTVCIQDLFTSHCYTQFCDPTFWWQQRLHCMHTHSTFTEPGFSKDWMLSPLPLLSQPPPLHPLSQTKERSFLPKNQAYLSTSSRSLQHIYQFPFNRYNIPINFFFLITAAYLPYSSSQLQQHTYQLLLDHCSIPINFFLIATAYLSTSSWSLQHTYQLLLDCCSIPINFFLITAAYLSTSSWSLQHTYQLFLDCRSTSVNFLIAAAYLSISSW